ncbi:MAG TPA: 4-alpha-glucanotransferase, partial [Clostridiaceae bacterium]|nr:4-alpha-glucanotransferase [Clostridiaceae bacterium]
LVAEGLLTEQECAGFVSKREDESQVDFDFVKLNNEFYLRLAYSRVDAELMSEVFRFARSQSWLHDYALFVVIRQFFDHLPWWEWPDEGLRKHETESLNRFAEDHSLELNYIYFTQWLFFRQWSDLKTYANEKGVGIIGDLPLYVARDGSDVWSNTHLFDLNENLEPIEVAGVPPDYFTVDGQLWGNPLYRWDVMEAEEFDWWIERLHFSLELYNRIRIDHFRGLESYWAVPASHTNARNGRWRKGPGMKLFRTIERRLGEINVIAEDLGEASEAVRQLVIDSGIPGMKVFQFAFDPYFNDQDLPHRYTQHLCVYSGTHDNATTLGWIQSCSEDERRYVLDYIGLPRDTDWQRGGEDAPFIQAVLRTLWASVAFFVCAPIQDFLGYDDTARMNIPGVPDGNWDFRVPPGVLGKWNTTDLKRMNLLYGRNTPYKDSFATSFMSEAEREMRRRQYERLYNVEKTIEALAKLNK